MPWSCSASNSIPNHGLQIIDFDRTPGVFDDVAKQASMSNAPLEFRTNILRGAVHRDDDFDGSAGYIDAFTDMYHKTHRKKILGNFMSYL